MDCQRCESSMVPDFRGLLMTHSECLATWIVTLSEAFRSMPEWSQRLIADRTPFLASDETFEIVSEREKRISFKSRNFIYCADLERMQVI